MKKLQILIGILIAITILACSPDDISPDPETNQKRLIKITFGNSSNSCETYIYYGFNNKVTNILTIDRDIPTHPHFDNVVYTYKNNLIVSARRYWNVELIETYTYNYVNNNLTEIKRYDGDGTFSSRSTLTYNAENKIENICYESTGHKSIDSYTYDTNGHVVKLTYGNQSSVLEYDTHPRPDSNFTYANQYIFSVARTFPLSKNNIIKDEYTNYTLQRISTTTITYDNDNYPIAKITVSKDPDGSIKDTAVTTYEYE